LKSKGADNIDGSPSEMSMSYFQILSLEGESSDELKPLELSLHGPFADMVLLPSAGGDLSTPAAALLVLTSPGLLHIYDGAGIDSFFNAATEDGCSPSSLQPVPWQSPTTAEVVAVKLITVSRLAAAANVLIQLTQNHKVLPYALPAGTRWPITGGVASRVTSSGDQGKKMNILLTGHKTGIIQVWDASSPTIQHICTVEAQNKDNPAPVTVMDFCGESGLLAVGDQQGKVHVFRLNAQAQEVKCYKITSGTPTEEVFNTAAGFQCIAALTVHLAAIQTVVVTHDPARLAVGDESGMVSLLDLGTCSLLFYCNFFESNLSITSLVVTSTQSSNESMHTTSPPSSPSTSQKQPIPPSFTTMVYAANKNGAVVVLDGSTGGHLAGPLQPQNSSVTVSMHILGGSSSFIK
jgi:syntaxin-binding protein 5